MGYISHNAILITSCDYENRIQEIRKVCVEILSHYDLPESMISPIVTSKMNDYASILIAPDGSKEGWDSSDKGDAFRDEIKQYLRKWQHGDWVEVQYGNDDGFTATIECNDCGMHEFSKKCLHDREEEQHG